MAGEASYSARWAVSDSSSFSGASVRWDFSSDSVRHTTQILDSAGMMGTRARGVSRTRFGPEAIGGQLTINPSPKFLGWALPRFLGGGSETVPAFADAIPEWWLLGDRGTGTATADGSCWKFHNGKGNRLSIVGRPGLLDCTMDVLFLDAEPGQTFAGAALETTLAYEPFQLADCTFLWDNGGQDISVNLLDFTLTIDNGLSPRYSLGATTPTHILEGNRRVTLTGNATMQSDFATLFAGLVKDGVPCQLYLVNGTCSTTFTFTRVQIPPDSYQIQGQEFAFPFAAEIRGTTGVEMTVSNDVTP